MFVPTDADIKKFDVKKSFLLHTSGVRRRLLTTKKKPILIILAVRRTLWLASPLLSISCWEMTSPTPTNDPGGQTGDRRSDSDHWVWRHRWYYSCSWYFYTRGFCICVYIISHWPGGTKLFSHCAAITCPPCVHKLVIMWLQIHLM